MKQGQTLFLLNPILPLQRQENEPNSFILHFCGLWISSYSRFTCLWSWRLHGIFICHLNPCLLGANLSIALPRSLEMHWIPEGAHGSDSCPSPHQWIHLLKEGACPWWMGALGFPVVPQEVFESVPTLLQCPQEALCTESFCNGPVHLAVLVTSAKLFWKWGLAENGQEGLGLLIAPVHTCCQE